MSNRLIVPALTLLAAACGGGGGGDNPPVVNLPPPPPPPPPVQTGVFKDLNVTGLAFESGGQSGITDANGRFSCETGDTVSFSLGGVDLGATDCATLVLPHQLADDTSMTFVQELINMARFLQMLDEDVDADNGIVISEPVQEMAETWSQVDFLTDDLETELQTTQTIIADAASVDPSPETVHALPSGADAFAHLSATFACAYADVYAGTISGANTGPAGLLIGLQLVGSSFIPFVWDALAVDGAEEFVVSVAGGGPGDFTTGNELKLSQGDFDVTFTTPDDVAGTWGANSIELHRIGSDDGSPHRFVGRANGADTDAIVSLMFDGTDFSGQAFEQSDGSTLDVTGSLNGDDVTLTAVGGGETFEATGTLTNYPDGRPDKVVGVVDNGANFGLAACRLN